MCKNIWNAHEMGVTIILFFAVVSNLESHNLNTEEDI